MSPERYSAGFRRHIREVKRQVRQAPTWEGMQEILENKYKYNEQLHERLLLSQGILKEFYDARLEIFQGQGSDSLNKFITRYSDKRTKNYDPELFDKLSPLFSTIRDLLS